MIPILGMPQGGEWLVLLAIVLLLFGSAKLPGLVKQLARSKKVWDKEVLPRRRQANELAEQVTSSLTTASESLPTQLRDPSITHVSD
ncbi:twin-arginine translocase TatA/TatE family subunit [Kribbella catacumbae]|uniref:twin-arginine translocase TatA/TatE family subunit n=1 Tax=Kribbella catacumbae TaxID=460086 RepID=UPI0003A88DCA|nr:twin-arginine translocase TatA/TatE family subunit [Kribbella catacumbae]